MHEIRLAVCCPDQAVRGIASRLRGEVVKSYPSEECDAVMLCRPALSAMGDVEHILAAGTHLLVVADPCPSPDAIASLFATARKRGVQFGVVNPDRYLPSRQLIRKQLSTLGEPGLVRIHRWEPPTAATEVAGLPDAILRDLDTTLWLVGRVPDRVFAVGQSGYLQVHLGFAHGGMALLDYTNRLPPGDGYQSLSVIAANGAAYADDHQNRQLLYRGGLPHAVRTEERAGQLAAIAQEFVDALREGRDLSVNAWKGVFAVADAVRKSLATRQAVALEGR